MRKFVIITTGLLGLAFAAPAFAPALAQSNSSESAPQPGLPPGAGFMAPNAQPPRASGDVATTPTGGSTPAAAAAPVAAPPRTLAASRAARARRLRRARARAAARASAPGSAATPATAAAPAQ